MSCSTWLGILLKIQAKDSSKSKLKWWKMMIKMESLKKMRKLFISNYKPNTWKEYKYQLKIQDWASLTINKKTFSNYSVRKQKKVTMETQVSV